MTCVRTIRVANWFEQLYANNESDISTQIWQICHTTSTQTLLQSNIMAEQVPKERSDQGELSSLRQSTTQEGQVEVQREIKDIFQEILL